jgi:hypothetical protein
MEMATWDAQQTTLNYAQAISFAAACRDDPHHAGLLRDWASEGVWTVLDLAEAIKSEGSARGGEQVPPSLPPVGAPTPGEVCARFSCGPLRSALPSQARRHAFEQGIGSPGEPSPHPPEQM